MSMVRNKLPRRPGRPRGYKYPHRPTYSTWRSMLARCKNEKSKYYGGKGIKVCERWQGPDGYFNFVEDMGERPDGHTIDRYPNNDGNYEPGNCRWANKYVQAYNKSDKSNPTGRTLDEILQAWVNGRLCMSDAEREWLMAGARGSKRRKVYYMVTTS